MLYIIPEEDNIVNSLIHNHFKAVEESLKSVSLFDGGVGDKPAGNYSGGMKRRLSVAISLIGNPKVHAFLLLVSCFQAIWFLTSLRCD